MTHQEISSYTYIKIPVGSLIHSTEMEEGEGNRFAQVFRFPGLHMRRCIFKVLSQAAIPNHIAFIMDGNRRYARKEQLTSEGAGHRAGFLALMAMLKYCGELGVKYITIYAFSIDNFHRRPDEVQLLMDLMLEKIELLLKEGHLAGQYGVRVIFIGNLKLLSEPVRAAAEKAMIATKNNTKATILVCVAYTSTNEIIGAVEKSCKGKLDISHAITMKSKEACDSENKYAGHEWMHQDNVKLVDVEREMFMAVAPDPDILIRTGENRLSNFLLWQTPNCLLYSTNSLWPEIGLRHLVWAVLNFQRAHSYLEKKKKQP
ncbi:dehydrodolichyl diphosphate synthase 6-like [Carica papaya]|uniref:dehydrodolichyl diphosphate synthase 6-like n=1 Tax=Carica papaya TaxID=3649 RepID=UPI000B8CF8A9|nr:dehydrodolichyl diphosphate synthase 6-like [Carica papaya]